MDTVCQTKKTTQKNSLDADLKKNELTAANAQEDITRERKRKANLNKAYYKKYPERKRETDRKYRQKNPLKIKNISLQKKFGISINEYQELSNKQKNQCAICEIAQSDLKRSLAVDHCHKTGKVRGLLCHHCNTAIGSLKENPKLFLKAIDYLEKSVSNI